MNDINTASIVPDKFKYRGRFAPSPSGPLHFGSLIAALASFLDAKFHQGTWCVRIEDIDPPREVKGSSSLILKALECYGLHWDESVLYQSEQSQYYDQTLLDIHRQGLSYYCQCTRADIKKMGGTYNAHCKSLSHASHNSATRLINQAKIMTYTDLFQGEINTSAHFAQEDFIIKRKDGLYAYQLAVVLDDMFQEITHVIRGCDLLEPTARQLSMYSLLGHKAPLYGHVPLAIDIDGYKLSKQNKATALDLNNPAPALFSALMFLGQQPPPELRFEKVESILQWGIAHWKRHRIPAQQEIPLKHI